MTDKPALYDRIREIVLDQLALEEHQRRKKMPALNIEMGQRDAYGQIVRLVTEGVD